MKSIYNLSLFTQAQGSSTFKCSSMIYTLTHSNLGLDYSSKTSKQNSLLIRNSHQNAIRL